MFFKKRGLNGRDPEAARNKFRAHGIGTPSSDDISKEPVVFTKHMSSPLLN